MVIDLGDLSDFVAGSKENEMGKRFEKATFPLSSLTFHLRHFVAFFHSSA